MHTRSDTSADEGRLYFPALHTVYARAIPAGCVVCVLESGIASASLDALYASQLGDALTVPPGTRS